MDYTPIISFFSDPKTWISIAAGVISIATFVVSYRRTKKTEQIKIAMEISDKIDEDENKILNIMDEIHSVAEDRFLAKHNQLKTNLKDAYLLNMNHWEFYSFLVNNEHIDNQNIKKYFEDNFKSGTDDFFKKYPTYFTKADQFQEIKNLRKAIGYEPKLI